MGHAEAVIKVRRWLQRLFIGSLLFLLVIDLLLLAVERHEVSSGTEVARWAFITDFVGVPASGLLTLSLALGVMPALLIWTFRAPRVAVWKNLALLVAGILVLWSVGGAIGNAAYDLRIAAFEREAERMAPLIAGIEAYESKQGRPPAKLEDIVPAYIARLPTVGVRSCWALQYTAPARYRQNVAWELRIECPNGFSTWDQFFYWPGQEYPEDRRHSRVGQWAYFWD
jgi:hypothetical protein